MLKMDENYKYVRCVEPDTFRPMLRVENIVSDEKWMVNFEDITDPSIFRWKVFNSWILRKIWEENLVF